MDFNEKIPVISIIIPMYNAENFIKQCLRSIFKQTFTDYEIIAVDDCSTDLSVEIVENFIKARKEKTALRLIKLPNNSGGAAIPRNVGMKMSRGKYITFVDSDDMLMPDALAIMLNAAIETNADVVHAEGYLRPIEKVGESFKAVGATYQSEPFVEEITLETDDISARLDRFCDFGYLWNMWSKLYRRDFLIENQIEFNNMRTVEDFIFVFKCVCCARRYVRIPNMFYIYRVNDGSITQTPLPLEKHVTRYVSSLSRGIKALGAFFDEQPFFADNPLYRTKVIQFLFEVHMTGELKIYMKYPTEKIDQALRKAFASESIDGSDLVMTYLLHNFCLLRLKVYEQEKAQSTSKG